MRKWTLIKLTIKTMTNDEIRLDRNARKEACKNEIDAVLLKYEYYLEATDMITPSTRINVDINMVDIKKYDTATVAQEVNSATPMDDAPVATTDTTGSVQLSAPNNAN